VAVEDDLSAGNDVFRVQQPCDLGVIDARQPGARKRDSSRDVTPSSLSVRAPAVVRVQSPDVDDCQIGVGEPPAQLGRGDGGTGNVGGHLRGERPHPLLVCGNYIVETRHRTLLLPK